MKLSASDVRKIVTELKKKHGAKVYTPYKYFDGLKSRAEVESRFQNILVGSKTASNNSSAYKWFDTDKKEDGKVKKTKTSKYTKRFFDLYPQSYSISQKSKSTGIPKDILQKVYDKGYAAWRTGHRVGAGPEQWGYARVHSFALLGCTALSADASLMKNALKRMKPSNSKKIVNQKIMCESDKLKKKYYKKIGMEDYIKKLRSN